ncbi:MAG: hypothetical protein OEM96_06820 [Gemmatimonadota bacterium]|nr:hypothetical protein [Gemmatimonadota bacterium]
MLESQVGAGRNTRFATATKSLMAACVVLIPLAAARGQAASAEPRESGLSVQVEVSLQFIDAEVIDAAGRPIPGLAAEDFSLRLNSKRYPIYSVDDLSNCGAADVARPADGLCAESFSQ